MKKIQQFYENVITFDTYIEVRIMEKGRQGWQAYYAETFQELIKIFQEHQDTKYNIYIGCNPRQKKSMKDKDITQRKTFFFDVEYGLEGEKPTLEDKEYTKKLQTTINFICNYLKDKFQLKPTWISTSGRGMHVGFKIKQYDIKQYEPQFRKWFTTVQQAMMNIRPFEDIKFDDPMVNIGRVESAPGTRHTKYPELPLRKILYLDAEYENNLTQILEKVNLPNNITYNSKAKIRKKYSVKDIFTAPEFQVFKCKPQSGTGINNRLRLSLKLLMRACKFTFEETEVVAQEIMKYGFPYKTMFLGPNEYNDYEYSESILNNYVIDNYEWAVKQNFKLPYLFKFKNLGEEDKKEFFDWGEPRKIETFQELLSYIVEFHEDTSDYHMGKRIYYVGSLIHNLKRCSVNKYLLLFVQRNNLWNKINKTISFPYKNVVADDDVEEWVIN